MVDMADKLKKMFEKSKDDGQLKSIANKRHITSKMNDFFQNTIFIIKFYLIMYETKIRR